MTDADRKLLDHLRAKANRDEWPSTYATLCLIERQEALITALHAENKWWRDQYGRREEIEAQPELVTSADLPHRWQRIEGDGDREPRYQCEDCGGCPHADRSYDEGCWVRMFHALKASRSEVAALRALAPKWQAMAVVILRRAERDHLVFAQAVGACADAIDAVPRAEMGAVPTPGTVAGVLDGVPAAGPEVGHEAPVEGGAIRPQAERDAEAAGVFNVAVDPDYDWLDKPTLARRRSRPLSTGAASAPIPEPGEWEEVGVLLELPRKWRRTWGDGSRAAFATEDDWDVCPPLGYPGPYPFAVGRGGKLAADRAIDEYRAGLAGLTEDGWQMLAFSCNEAAHPNPPFVSGATALLADLGWVELGPLRVTDAGRAAWKRRGGGA